MTHSDTGFEGRVERLEQEVGRLRRDVGELMTLVGCVSSSEQAVPAVPEPARSAEPEPDAAPPAGAQAREQAAAVRPVVRARVPVMDAPRAELGQRPREPAPSLERRIGGQVFAIAGALIVIIGLGLAIKVAVDYGWFRVLPPALRCVGIAALGAGFLGAGEFLRTRVWPVAVAGCNAVGVAGLYIAAYAAFGVFHLIAAPVAFALMALAAGVGLAVALRHGFLSTGLLSLVGAYLVPILLAGSDAGPLVLPVYVLLLSVVALTLAVARPRPFSPMRDAAWFGSGLLGLMWTSGQVGNRPWLVVGFWACVWVLHQAELLVTASRHQLRPGVEGERPTTMPRILRRRVEPVLLAIATTAGVVAMTAAMLEHQLGLDAWLAPAAALLVTGALALVFGGHLRVLRDQPRTDLETLAAAHAAQAGGLLVATVALALSGWVEATAWLAMGVAAVLAGRWIMARSLDLYGVVLLAIATARVSTFDLFVGSAGVPWTVGAPLAIAPWTVLILAAAGAWLLTARLMLHRGRDEDGALVQAARPRLAVVCAAVGVGALLFAPAHPRSSAGAVCVSWLVLSLALRGASRLEGRLRLAEMGLVAAVASLVPWIAAAGLDRWLDSAAPIGLHPGAWLAGLCVPVMLAQAWCSRRWDRPTKPGGPGPVLAAIAGALALVASSIEVARGAAMLADDLTARRAAVSIWWGLWGVSLVVGGFWRRAGAVRYVGLALMSVAAVKAVLLDLAGVPPLWRVASFVGLGGLMLGVAVLYGRVSASLGDAERRGRAPEPGDPSPPNPLVDAGRRG